MYCQEDGQAAKTLQKADRPRMASSRSYLPGAHQAFHAPAFLLLDTADIPFFKTFQPLRHVRSNLRLINRIDAVFSINTHT